MLECPLKAFLLLIAISLASLSGSVAQTLKIGGIQELRAFGPLVSDVFAEAGFPVEMVWIPNVRLGTELKNDNVDGAFFFTDIALQAIPGVKKVPVELYQNEYIAITANPSIRIRSIPDLARFRVGYIRGNAAAEEILKQVKGTAVQDVTDSTQLFKMLGSGRVDAIVSTKAALDIFGGEAGTRLFPQEPILLSLPLFLAMSPRMEAYLPHITAVFERAVKSGVWTRRVQQFLNSFGASPPPGQPPPVQNPSGSGPQNQGPQTAPPGPQPTYNPPPR